MGVTFLISQEVHFTGPLSDPDGSVVLNQAKRNPNACLEREFRVYNSLKIPKLYKVTSKAAARPLLHGIEPVLQAA